MTTISSKERSVSQIIIETSRAYWDEEANDAIFEYMKKEQPYRNSDEIISMICGNDELAFYEKFRQMGLDQRAAEELNDRVVYIIQNNEELRSDLDDAIADAFALEESNLFRVTFLDLPEHVANGDEDIKAAMEDIIPRLSILKEQVKEVYYRNIRRIRS